jgi:hypothetical protein
MYPTTHCRFTTAWVDAIYGSEFHRTDGGGDMLYTGPFYSGKRKVREARRAAILTFVPHTAKLREPKTADGKYEPRMGSCRICELPGGDHPEAVTA